MPIERVFSKSVLLLLLYSFFLPLDSEKEKHVIALSDVIKVRHVAHVERGQKFVASPRTTPRIQVSFVLHKESVSCERALARTHARLSARA